MPIAQKEVNMLSIKTSGSIRTMRNIKGYRSCPTSTGISLWDVDTERLLREEMRLLQRKVRRWWLNEQWNTMPQYRSVPNFK
ncbi:MAG: hypothetical protein AABY74_02615 [Planctomycetota bacterium]